jgi:hypothetical protein
LIRTVRLGLGETLVEDRADETPQSPEVEDEVEDEAEGEEEEDGEEEVAEGEEAEEEGEEEEEEEEEGEEGEADEAAEAEDEEEEEDGEGEADQEEEEASGSDAEAENNEDGEEDEEEEEDEETLAKKQIAEALARRSRSSGVIPYVLEQTILLVGEGNFSFARALATILRAGAISPPPNSREPGVMSLTLGRSPMCAQLCRHQHRRHLARHLRGMPGEVQRLCGAHPRVPEAGRYRFAQGTERHSHQLPIRV